MAIHALLFLLTITLLSSVWAVVHPSSDRDVVGEPVPNAAAHCADFTAACSAEASGQLAEAFQLYEKKYEECGSSGWRPMGAGEGSRSVVMLRRTPCGLGVAVKKIFDRRECEILQLAEASQAACPGCFPRCYYHSNTTFGAYMELLPNDTIPLVQFFRSPPHIRAIKSLFLQGLSAIKLLRKFGWEHNDFGGNNMVITPVYEPDGSRRYRLVVFDLASARRLNETGQAGSNSNVRALHTGSVAAGSDRGPVNDPPSRSLRPNGVHSDLYMLAIQFYTLARFHGHRGRPDDKPPVYNMTTLESALWDIMAMVPDTSTEPDYRAIRLRIQSVRTLAP